LCENPVKETKRWRQLKGFDLKSIDLERKAWATQIFINEQENKATEKDITLEEVPKEMMFYSKYSYVYRYVLHIIKVIKGTELSKKMNENVRNQMSVSRALVAAISELALVQVAYMTLTYVHSRFHN
jgi:hypothetical protein